MSLPSDSRRLLVTRPRRLVVRTAAFHAANGGSIPPGAIGRSESLFLEATLGRPGAGRLSSGHLVGPDPAVASPRCETRSVLRRCRIRRSGGLGAAEVAVFEPVGVAFERDDLGVVARSVVGARPSEQRRAVSAAGKAEGEAAVRELGRR